MLTQTFSYYVPKFDHNQQITETGDEDHGRIKRKPFIFGNPDETTQIYRVLP
jgi:hypothetical protein